MAWVPHGDGFFVVAHADGNVYIYDKVIATKTSAFSFFASLFLELDISCPLPLGHALLFGFKCFAS